MPYINDALIFCKILKIVHKEFSTTDKTSFKSMVVVCNTQWICGWLYHVEEKNNTLLYKSFI